MSQSREIVRWEKDEVRTMLAILADMNIEKQIDEKHFRKDALFTQVAERLRGSNINRT